MIPALSDVITTLQLLAQRQVLQDTASKPHVIFYMDGGKAIACVRMLCPTSGGTPVQNAEYKATGKNYTEAASLLLIQMAETITKRQVEDHQVTSLAARYQEAQQDLRSPISQADRLIGKEDNTFPAVR